MPIKRSHVIATFGKHSLVAVSLIFILLISSCAPQPASFPPVVQGSPVVSSSVVMNTFTPAPVSQETSQGQRIYVLVAPFPTVTDGVTSGELIQMWTQGVAPAPFAGHPLLMDEPTRNAISSLWDEPASGAVRTVASDQLLDAAWSEPGSWAIVPFEALEPKWKVITIDGQSPIRKKFDISTYPLVISVSPESSNYDPARLTTIIMTGVTALVRATAYTMELKSVTYPGEKIRDIMREADLAHISNEIPFFSGCTFPKPEPAALVFCSDPKYIELLLDVGTDVIELTGNHFADRGAEGMLETIDLYNKNGLPYFGGGIDLQDSLKPALFEVNGNKIAFIGCNKPDVNRFPTATDLHPGAAPCDVDYLTGKINQLKAEGYVVVSTFQWNESYDPRPGPDQVRGFQLMADSGAAIVSGSQAHYAQKMEFRGDAFIHYGLGNMFFDQMGDLPWMPKGIRRVFLDRYVVYNGKLISVELITAMMEDYSRPRPMTEEERSSFLQEYYYYSGWTPLVETPTPTITPTLTPMVIPPPAGTPTLTPLPTATRTP